MQRQGGDRGRKMLVGLEDQRQPEVLGRGSKVEKRETGRGKSWKQRQERKKKEKGRR